MANIVLKTFAAGDEGQGTVTPQDDALIYQNAVSVNGIFGGATVTLTGANTLHVASGFGIICGRFFEINENDISVQLSSSGTLRGRLKIHLDLNNADNPIEIVTETGATLPALSGDSNININGGAFDMELCTFNVNEITISSVVNTFPTIDNTSRQIRRNTAYSVNDFALCQSASESLIFICTTAGTTAVSEPTGYTTITDGNTITDGTAVFKAVSVAGKINAIGNLSSLTTTDKTTLVNAVNEVDDKVSKTEVLISNSGDAYSSTKAYAVGDLCIYNDTLYRCITACSAGSWATNQSCFTQDTLVNVLENLNITETGNLTLISNSYYTGTATYFRKGNVISISMVINVVTPNAVAHVAVFRLPTNWTFYSSGNYSQPAYIQSPNHDLIAVRHVHNGNTIAIAFGETGREYSPFFTAILNS